MRFYLWAFILLAMPAYGHSHKSEGIRCPSAFRALKEGNFEKAVAQANGTCPTINKVATYLSLTQTPEANDLSTFSSFIKHNPGWPFLNTIRVNASRANMDRASNDQIIRWFKANHPKSTKGALRFVDAMASSGKIDKVAFNNIWIENDLDEASAKKFITKYRKHITYVSHKKRANRLFEDGQSSLAKQMMPYLNENDQQILKAKIALRNKNNSQLPEELANDKGYLLEKLKFYKASDDLAGCKILVNHPGNSKWLPIRLYFAREALQNGKAQLAYNTMKKHGADEPADLSEAEWFLGWVAFEYLDKPDLALKHFKTMHEVVMRSHNKSKSHFWLAQVYKDLGDEELAEKHFKDGAKYPATFYGQMSARELGIKPKIHFMAAPDASSAKFNNMELVKAVSLLKAAGMAEKTMPFLYMIGKQVHSREEKGAFIKLVKNVLPEYTVRAIKQIDTSAQHVYKEGYPTMPIKGFDKKFIFSVIRQESEFDGNQISYAGAHGLMQLMPPTAKMYATKLGMPYNQAKLTKDASYNIALGSAFLQDKFNSYDGSFIKAAASYNAGHGPVRKWVERNGPLDEKSCSTLDMVNWVEKISYSQTRDYVQKVLGNYAVYEQITK